MCARSFIVNALPLVALRVAPSPCTLRERSFTTTVARYVPSKSLIVSRATFAMLNACIIEHGVACEQSAVSGPVGDAYTTDVSATQAPLAKSQTMLGHSSSDEQPRHARVIESHTGAVV